jgi:hypothetical protein
MVASRDPSVLQDLRNLQAHDGKQTHPLVGMGHTNEGRREGGKKFIREKQGTLDKDMNMVLLQQFTDIVFVD